MAVVKCKNKHYYDDEKFSNCPHCDMLSTTDKQNKTIRSIYSAASDDEIADVLRLMAKASPQSEEENTSPYAWLICTDGPSKGKDFKLHIGRNFIGKSKYMDISIPDDSHIIEKCHCSVLFEARNENSFCFYAMPGEFSATYVNFTLINNSVALYNGDIISVGDTNFVFIVVFSKSNSSKAD